MPARQRSTSCAARPPRSAPTRLSGWNLDYSEISGGGKSMLFLVASGTAVKLRQEG